MGTILTVMALMGLVLLVGLVLEAIFSDEDFV